MPTLSEFLGALERSRLLPRSEVDSVRAGLEPQQRNDLAAVVRALVEQKLLTRFQAAKLFAGKIGPFFLGKYKIMAQLGSGGMGKVYLARHTETQSRVAIKVLPPRRAAAERNALARFQREADLSLRLSHPHVAETLDVGEDAGAHFMVMEYIPGQSLFDMVQKGGALRAWDAARLFCEAAQGLAHVHHVGLVHRDIKPSNIMVTPDGTAKILDLGLARATTEEESQLTRPGTVLGTMDYIAPEQASGEQHMDPRSDIYSLGCTLYFAVTGQPPFPGGDIMSKLYRHRMEEPVAIEKLAPGIPKEFGALVRKMMAKEPGDRYATADELASDLKKWTSPELVRGLVGAAADSGQQFRPPPPELDTRELHFDGESLRSLGDDQPTEAPVTRAATLSRTVSVSPQGAGQQPRPAPLRRTKPPKVEEGEPNDSNAGIYVVIGVIVALGIAAIVLLAILDQMNR